MKWGWKNPAATCRRVGGTSLANEWAPGGKEKFRQSLVWLVGHHSRRKSVNRWERECRGNSGERGGDLDSASRRDGVESRRVSRTLPTKSTDRAPP